MRRDQFDAAPGFCNTVKLADKRHHVRDVLDYVAADDFIEFVVRKWIRNGPQVMNDISLSSGIGIDANCAGKLV